MTGADSCFPPQIEAWASRQLADYDAHQPGTLFAEGIVLHEAEAYQLQSAVARLRVARGERVIGYKVGCTSPAIRQQLGIDHCIYGRLYDGERHASGVSLIRSAFANLAVEGELAIELAREPTRGDFSVDGVPTCVARVFPVIELHHHVIRGELPTPGELIANNAIHAGFVASEGIRRASLLSEPWLAIYGDDQLLDRCRGVTLIETIRDSLKWLAATLRGHGQQLHAGQIVLTGSIPRLLPIAENCQVRVDAHPFGHVRSQLLLMVVFMSLR